MELYRFGVSETPLTLDPLFRRDNFHRRGIHPVSQLDRLRIIL